MIETLTSLRAAGESYALIAKRLGVTRNACCGKADRLGLPPVLSGNMPEKQRAARGIRVVRRLKLLPKPEMAVVEPPPRGDVPDGCRYMHAEAAARNFCGAPCVDLESWCDFHLTKVWAKAKAA